jgi:N-acetylglucosamine-6-sulfatase
VGSIALLLLLGTSCSGSEASASDTPQEEEAESATDRPNILFILTDDLDYASTQKMPQITSLVAQEGLSFEEAFVSHPMCCPSRATILTGLYDHNHHVLGNGPTHGGFQKFVSEGHEENTIAVHLKEEGGYRTAFFGKYLNQYPNQDEPPIPHDPNHVPPGWDEWYAKMADEEGEKATQRLYDYEINENGEVVSYGSEESDFYTDVLSEQVTDFVRRAALEEQPFFAYVAPTAPHGPATPAQRHKGAFADEEAPRPPSFNEQDVSEKPSGIRNRDPLSEGEVSAIDERYQDRLESMLAVDEMVTSLIKELEAAGELENTYIFFSSDNGFEQGEHRIPQGKERPYEESVRVPLFVWGPGIASGSEVEQLVLNTDFAPTFADLAKVEFAADGRSLAPLLLRSEDGEQSSSQSSPWRSSVLLEKLPVEDNGANAEETNSKRKGKAKGKGKGKAKSETKEPTFEAIRTESHKYIEYDNGDVELYDLQADPYELESLHESADPALVEDLKARLEALKSCSGEGCREAEDAS